MTPSRNSRHHHRIVSLRCGSLSRAARSDQTATRKPSAGLPHCQPVRKPVKTQWDFGELFPREQTRQVLTVADLTSKIRKLLEGEIGEVWVTGEVSNLKVAPSGHAYFSLKDANAQLSCVLFRDEALGSRNLLADGVKAVVRGTVSVYEMRGQYQLTVTHVELQGLGDLQAAFERLKARLQAEGLFAPEKKRALPEF